MIKKFLALILLSLIFSLNAYDKEDLDQLKNSYQTYFKNLDLSEVTFYDMDYALNKRHFNEVNFYASIFNQENLADSTFIKCNFENCYFNDTILLDACFINCNMQNAHISIDSFYSARFDKKSSEGIIFY